LTVHRAIGGAIVTDYGAVSLERARQMAIFYGIERRRCREENANSAARLCARREADLWIAVAATVQWRKAAGWRDPGAADFPAPLDAV
jgi:hypothetical protein